jgi:hypothetical protein
VMIWMLADAPTEVVEDVLDPAMFVALYLGVVATVFALGDPISKLETRVRAATLIFCALIAVIMVAWLLTAILRIAGWLG